MTVRAGPDVEQDFAALVAVLRRFLARRVPPDDVEDFVQEAVAKVLARRPDLTGDALAAYSLVTARNLVVNAARQRRRRGPPTEIDPATAETPAGSGNKTDPLAALVSAEERVALLAALDRLAEADRSAFVAREEGASTGELARRMGTSPGAVAVRLARARAKLRVDYVVALEHASLPSSRCRPVLLALSAHDRQAQAASGAGHHLLDCATCASLAPPLLERRRPVAFVVPALLGHRVWTWGRRRPLQAGAAIAVAIAVVVPLRGMTAGDERTTAPAPACPFSVSVEGRAVSLSDSAALRSRAGASVRGTGIPVLDVAADEGFWVGCGGSDVWVQLVGDGESSQEVGTGARVDFTGRIVAHAVGFGATVGNEGDAARRLDDQRLHIEVAYQDLSVN